MYERERGGDESLPGVDEVIEALGGTKLMVKIRTEKTRARTLSVGDAAAAAAHQQFGDGALAAQIATFLERAALSARGDGVDVDRDA